MTIDPADGAVGGQPRPARRWPYVVGALIAAYLVVAYVILPLAWRTDTRRHPGVSDGPRLTVTANGIPGDPINIALEGAESEVIHGMLKAGWFPADPITFDSSVRIAVDSVFRRPDEEAPVSALYLFGRKQDLAFEQPVGNSPRQRHHVRFWRWDKLEDDRPVWFGSATFDERVGLSYTTGQVTHHIGPDVDAERDRIIAELQKAGAVQRAYWVDGFQQPPAGEERRRRPVAHRRPPGGGGPGDAHQRDPCGHQSPGHSLIPQGLDGALPFWNPRCSFIQDALDRRYAGRLSLPDVT